jgi:hypothetical protein
MSEQEVPFPPQDKAPIQAKMCAWCRLPIEGEVKFWLINAKQLNFCVKCYNKVLVGLPDGKKK